MTLKIKLLRGDCLQRMLSLADQSVDMILTDLPFGTTKCSWDSVIDLNSLWDQYSRIAKPDAAIVLFAQTPFDKVLGSSKLDLLRYEWIWEKTLATGFLNAKTHPLKAHENILVFYNKPPIYQPQMEHGHTPVHSYTKRLKNQRDSECYGATQDGVSGGGSTSRYPRSVLLFAHDRQRIGSYHPTQKPIALCEYLIKTYTKPHQIVLDSCMGSGTTGLAALSCHRSFIGIEKDNKYYRISKDRILEKFDHLKQLNQINQQALF